MPKLEFFLVAESVAVDQSTNRISIFHVIEEIRGIILPKEVNVPRGVLPQLVAVSSWLLRDDEVGKKYQVEFLIHRSGTDGPIEMGKSELVAESRRHRILHIMLGCPMAVGDMQFECLLDGQHQASHVVTVYPPEKPVETKQESANGEADSVQH